jgi:HEAT repeats/Putative zinc-finger
MMRCDTSRESIVLMIHGELEGAERLDLEAHLRECPTCSAALEEERRLVALFARTPDDGPSPDLLRRCRDGLHRALVGETTPGKAAGTQPVSRTWRLRLSPAWALALLAAGFAVGRALPGAGLPSLGPRPDTAPEAGTTIANVDFHETDPRSDRVSLTYDTLRRTSLSGTAGDPQIRRVLVDTVRDSRNAGLRLMALDVLRGHADDREVRAALVRAVRDDDNAGARLKALDALRGRAADDPEVRGAIVEALVKDTNPGVRVRAIDALQGTRGPETQAVLKRLADQDPNEYVRLRSAALLGEMLPQESAR